MEALPIVWPGTNDLAIFRVAALGFLLLLTGTPLAWVLLLQVRELMRRRGNGEQIVVTADGILYSDSSRQAHWKLSQIRSIQIRTYGRFLQLKGRYVVQIDTGESFDFVQPMVRSKQLAEQIAQHTDAFGLGAEVWQFAESADPSETHVNTSGVRFYHYRSRPVRAILLGGLAPVAVVVSGVLIELREQVTSNQESRTFGVILACVLAGGYMLAATWFLRAGIMATEQGVNQVGLVRSRFLRWADIDDYYIRQRNERTKFVLTGKGKELEFEPEICGMPDLLKLVQTRAINSRSRAWKIETTKQD